MCLRNLKRYEEADQCLDKALVINPRLAAVWYHRGRNWINRGFLDKANECYHRALYLLISLKRKEEALEIIGDGLKHFPSDNVLRQFQGWTVRLRGKDLEKSLRILEDLYNSDKENAGTAGILAGTYKRLWAANPERHRDMLQKAYEIYFKAWENSKKANTYEGINAATLSLLLGKPEDSREIAREIKTIYEMRNLKTMRVSGNRFSSYWDRVTLAEAELLLGHLGRARRLYKDIVDLYDEKRSYVDSSMDQIDLILPHLGLSISAIQFMHLSRPFQTRGQTFLVS